MALRLNERYPGRFNNPSPDYPQGSFKNRTTPTAKDGSYLEKDWANDKEGFFQSLLAAAVVAANGITDKVGASQYFDAMKSVMAQAISAKTQSSATDTTAGRLLTVGSFGLGGVSPAFPGNDLNTNISYSGTFGVSTGCLNAPPGWTVQGSIVRHDVWLSVGAAQQTFEEHITGRTARRALNAGAWSVWQELITAGNIPAATEAGAGILRIATQDETTNAVDDSKAVTPKKLGVRLSQFAPLSGSSSQAFNVASASSPSNATPLSQVQGLVSGSPAIQGAFKNLRLLATGTGRSVVVSADEIILENTSGQYVTLRGVSITGNNGTGMDAGSVAASTWYSVWLIYNGTNQFVLFSLSATSPTMPGGYTFRARIGWIRTDSTANAYPLGFIQAGRSVKYVVAAGSNLTSFPQMASGVSGSTVTPTFSSVAVASFFPPTAGVVETIVGVVAPNGFVMVAPGSAYGAYSSSTNIPFTYSAGTNGPYSSGFARFILDTPNIYWASSLAGNTLNAIGWEDNL